MSQKIKTDTDNRPEKLLISYNDPDIKQGYTDDQLVAIVDFDPRYSLPSPGDKYIVVEWEMVTEKGKRAYAKIRLTKMVR